VDSLQLIWSVGSGRVECILAGGGAFVCDEVGFGKVVGGFCSH